MTPSSLTSCRQHFSGSAVLPRLFSQTRTHTHTQHTQGQRRHLPLQFQRGSPPSATALSLKSHTTRKHITQTYNHSPFPLSKSGESFAASAASLIYLTPQSQTYGRCSRRSRTIRQQQEPAAVVSLISSL